MIKDFFRKTNKPIGELIIETTRELGKCYSRLELFSSKLAKRNEVLFETCSNFIRKNAKARASIYANEIAEIRSVLSVVQHSQLQVERAILRLDTLKMVSPPLQSIEETFCDVKKALGLVGNILPSITPEFTRLNETVNQVLDGTQLNLDLPTNTTLTDPAAKTIIKEASNIVEKQLQEKIPEPPKETMKLQKRIEPLIALSSEGTEEYLYQHKLKNAKKENDILNISLLLLEELVIDYIERNNGNLNVKRCSEELNVPKEKVLDTIDSLKNKDRIKIQQ
jgi:division protein CdvB (Snf7/Vps24/ESCRT-III family)